VFVVFCVGEGGQYGDARGGEGPHFFPTMTGKERERRIQERKRVRGCERGDVERSPDSRQMGTICALVYALVNLNWMNAICQSLARGMTAYYI